jgi:hypothetical protein
MATFEAVVEEPIFQDTENADVVDAEDTEEDLPVEETDMGTITCSLGQA